MTSNAIVPVSSVSSDESFAPLNDTAPAVVEPTSVDAEPHINDTLERIDGEDKPLVDQQTLEQCLLLVRQQFAANNVNEAHRKDKEEDDYAALLSLGYRNALDWLDNKTLLYAALSKVGMTPASDNVKLLGQIAKLQLGNWNATGKAWIVLKRRDERLGRFYRIFFADKTKYPVDNLRQVIIDFKGRSGGILKSVEVKQKPLGKKELADNREAALKVEPLTKAKTSKSVGKLGQYRLALVRVTGAGFDVCSIVEDEGLTNRLADKWAAEAAMTVDTSAE